MLVTAMSNQQPQPQAAPPSDEVAALQRDVQRLLGRCMLRLQQYEGLLKAIVAHHELAGPADSLERTRDRRIQETATNTLGVLIGKLLESYVVVSGVERELLGADIQADAIGFGFRMNLQMDAEDYAHTRDGLKELLELRNGLVHHFIERFDLMQVDTCAAAKEHLMTCYERIDAHYEQLRSWIEHMEQTRQLAASFMQSSAFHDLLVDGIAPDGIIDWSAAGCVRVLREASARLAIDGWTPLDAAVEWIRADHPDQTPEKYHCRTWRQVLSESRRFELFYRDEDGRKQPWYRERITAK